MLSQHQQLCDEIEKYYTQYREARKMGYKDSIEKAENLWQIATEILNDWEEDHDEDCQQ